MGITYGTQVQPTVTGVASLASSSTFVAGYETSWVDNTSTLADDYLVSGFFTVGTTPTAETEIILFAMSQQEDTPAYPDAFDSTASAETLTSVGVGDGFLRLVASCRVDSATSDRSYDFMGSIAAAFGGICPPTFGFFVTHNTGVNLNSTGANQEINCLPITYA